MTNKETELIIKEQNKSTKEILKMIEQLKGFTGIEINGVRFSNIKEMLICMDKQRDRIIDLEETINALREQLALRYDLEDKIAELKAQIGKMKCCQNCKHSRTEYEHCRTNKHEKWELKEE